MTVLEPSWYTDTVLYTKDHGEACLKLAQLFVFRSIHGYMHAHIHCMQKSGSMIMSMDGLFGLPRKKSAGSSFRDAIHGHLFFGEQAVVDEYVASATVKHVKEPKVCTCRLTCAKYRLLNL